jgi:hypothetical protein
MAQGPLRLRMLEFRVDIGLMPGRAGESRGQGRSIYDEKAATPKGLLACFPEEVNAMRRLARPVNRCFALALPPYQVFCLPYYYYDGLCALLFVEWNGEFIAAWCEREMVNALAPHPVLVNGTEAELQAFLRHVMLAVQPAP